MPNKTFFGTSDSTPHLRSRMALRVVEGGEKRRTFISFCSSYLHTLNKVRPCDCATGKSVKLLSKSNRHYLESV